MKTKFIINPISGTGKQKHIENIIEQYLDKNRFEYDICFTEYSLHAKEIAKQAKQEDYKLIVAVGGDGTVNEISSELIGSEVALSIIPAGSGNGLAFHFGIKRNLTAAVLQLNTSETKTIDSGTANGIPFVNVSGIGFDAHISHLFLNLKERGFSNYIKLIFKEINYKAKDYTICYNGMERKVNAILISFANATQYGNNFQISPNSKIDDGLIDFVIVKDMARWKIPHFLFKIAQGKIESSDFVEIIRTEKMKIKSKDQLIHLDGEPKKINGNIEVVINKNSLKIFVPNG